MFRILFLLLALLPTVARAAVCLPGEYLWDGTCTRCASPYYCPGDDGRYMCPSPVRASIPGVTQISKNNTYGHTGQTSPDDCWCEWRLRDATRRLFYQYGYCKIGPTDTPQVAYTMCAIGHYATGVSGNYARPYVNCVPCTNKPSGTTYTGYGTPVTPGSTEIGDNCPFACADGYGVAMDGSCQKLCELGYTKINTSTGVVALLFRDKLTTPALNVGDVNGACHAELIPGTTTDKAIHTQYNGQIYHTYNAPKTSSCIEGYYLDENEFKCVDCGTGYYCPGGTERLACRDLVPVDTLDNLSSITSLTGGSYALTTNATKSSDCACWWQYSDERRKKYIISARCQYGPINQQLLYYDWCNVGYYAIEPGYSDNYYHDCAPCYNGPANSHYTSYSTPSVMYAVESNCPWECDAGYVRDGDACVAE